MNTWKCLLAALVAATLSRAAHADFYQGLGVLNPELGQNLQSDTGPINSDTGSRVAENFNNTDFDPTAGEILRIRWFGAPPMSSVLGGDNFRIEFYADAGGVPSTTLGYALNLTSMDMNVSINFDDFPRFTEDGRPVHMYQHFTTDQGLANFLDDTQAYWISIFERDSSTDPTNPDEAWLWASADDQLTGNDFSASYGLPLGWKMTPDTNTGFGRAFSLRTIPEPSSALLLVFAAVPVLRRRLRRNAAAA